MNTEQAIKILEKNFQGQPLHWELSDALKEAFAALEKQVAKEPKWEDGIGFCPNCGALGNDGYCMSCGQLIACEGEV